MLRTIPGVDISLPSYLPKFGMLMLPQERPHRMATESFGV